KAAKSLNISQPSLTKYIKRLEKNLDLELFDHTTYPLRLTYAGERYLTYINQFRTMDARMRNELMDIKSDSRGKVVLGIGHWRASAMIPYLLSSFWKEHAGIEIVLREGPNLFLESLIEKNEVDFCIFNIPISHQKDIIYEFLMHELVLLAINSHNPILKKLNLPTRFTRQNIAHFDFNYASDQQIILPKGQILYDHTLEFLRNYAFHPKKIFETESISTALGMVNAGIGITFVPLAGVLFQNQLNNISFFTVGEPLNARNLGIAYKNTSYISHQARLFIDHIKACLTKFTNSYSTLRKG
ncbi:MAG: LysR family transcriptional regulator, partial [Spirochaetaceae bacterium]|nr:LysR family transcriptional regulator [Spirochaetaceae bacterium]